MKKIMTGKKIIIHDYAGHPFQLDLSIALAKKGFDITHIYTSSSGGPKAGFDRNIENLKIIASNGIGQIIRTDLVVAYLP